MTKETSAEYRRGFQDRGLVDEGSLQAAKDGCTREEKPGLERAMNIIAAIKVPQHIR